MRNEDPDVDTIAYFFYTGVFLFVLYELTVKHVRFVQDTKVMTLKNTSVLLSTNTLQAEAPSTVNGFAPQASSAASSFLSRSTASASAAGDVPRLRAPKDRHTAKLHPAGNLKVAQTSSSSATEPPRFLSADLKAARDL